MRLLNVNTLAFKEFFDQDIPPYGILSHRWGEDEISHRDFRKGRGNGTLGYRKIIDFCGFVHERRIFDFSALKNLSKNVDDELEGRSPILPGNEGEALRWVWIDSICIDKTSSQELSEAINSMYSWYANAEECYVYMRDVPSSEHTPAVEFWRTFDKSEWFTRGWTLQELLAPTTVVFCSSQWEVFGHMQTDTGREQYLQLAPFSHALRFELNERISQITGIQTEYLKGRESIESASIARRMSWAARRHTTRLEDEAYCLLGLFGVNMPLLYGEGRKAFLRLQEEIIKRSDDMSIFAWSLPNPDQERTGILAQDISAFQSSGEVIRAPWGPESPFSITNLGLEVGTRTQRVALATTDHGCAIHIVQLNCFKPSPYTNVLAPVEIALLQCTHGFQRTQRSRCNDAPKPGYQKHDLFSKKRCELEEAKFYIKLTSQHWDECRECRGMEWMLINQVSSEAARFLTPARKREQGVLDGFNGHAFDSRLQPSSRDG